MSELTIFVRLGLKDADAFKSGMRGAADETRRFRNEVEGGRGRRRVGEDIGDPLRRRRTLDPGAELDRLGSRVHHTGLALERSARRTGAALLSVVQPALEYDRAITDAVAVTGDAVGSLGNEELLRGLTTGFTELGFTSKDVAKSIGFMGMAGLDTQQILGSMASALNLAKAGSIDAARAIDLGTDVMTSFGLPVEGADQAMQSMTRTADVLTQTFTSSNTTLALASRSLFKIGPLATQAGVSIESAAAAVGVLASAGIKGSEAGTALRNVFLRLAKPTADVKDGFKKLGVDIKDVTQAIADDDLGKAFSIIGDAAERRGLDEIERLEVFGKIFGTRAAAAAAFLSQSAQTGVLQKQTAATRASAGITLRISEKKQKSDAAAVDRARARLDLIAVTLGQDVLPQLLPVAEGFLEIAQAVGKFSKEHPGFTKGLVTTLITFTAVGLVLGPVLTSMGSFIRLAGLMQTGLGAGTTGLTGAIGGTTTAAAGATGAVGKLTTGLGKAGLFGAALATSVAVFAAADRMFKISDRLAGIGGGVDEQGKPLARKRGGQILRSEEEQEIVAEARGEREKAESKIRLLVEEGKRGQQAGGGFLGGGASREEAQAFNKEIADARAALSLAKTAEAIALRKTQKSAEKRADVRLERRTSELRGRAVLIQKEREDIKRLRTQNRELLKRGKRGEASSVQAEIRRRSEGLQQNIEVTREFAAKTRLTQESVGKISQEFKLRVEVTDNTKLRFFDDTGNEVFQDVGATIPRVS